MKNSEKIDVLCVANYAAESSMLRRAILSQGDLIDGSFLKPFYYSIGDTKGAVILINSSNLDVSHSSGIKPAREQFVKALDYIVPVNPKMVVLLAAGLKRLFGRYLEEEIGTMVDGTGMIVEAKQTLRERYPEVLFTNGDNGTSALFIEEVKEIIKKAGIRRNMGKIGILGAGLLGTDVLRFLMSEDLADYQINVISSYTKELRSIINSERNIDVFENLDDVDKKIDFMICCTNTKSLTAKLVDSLSIKYVLDVSVPPAFVEREYFKAKNVYRRDAGNAYNIDLEYCFDPSIIDLSLNNMFGCFAEASSLAHSYNEKFFDLDLFTVNDEAKKIISVLFKKANFSTHPKPLCFGREI